MNNELKLLPLGSIVILKGGIQKVLIVARGMVLPVENEVSYFDYGGVLYPQGLVGDKILFFNHMDISKEIFKGFSDEDDSMMCENIIEWMNETDIPHGDPRKLAGTNNGEQ